MSADLGDLRIRYKDRSETFLEEHLVSKEPFGQFHAWFQEAKSNPKILEPNAMCLSTCTKDGFPSGRFVLCKGYGKDGFKFFTNLGSRKAKELKENPNAALTFYWEVLNRSIRIEGTVSTLSDEESTKYFHSRPIPSQIGASASYQSEPIESRDILCAREKILEQQYTEKGVEVPKPEFWGGYCLQPRSVEFWQGQRDRLHDRIKFRHPKENEIPDGKLLHQGDDGWNENPNAALTFYWQEANRSVRVEGTVSTLSDGESAEYFHSRPIPSQLGASSSYQSEPIESKDILYARVKMLEQQCKEKGVEVPVPEYWGGYSVHPSSVEFWQGQMDRLSDRIKFRRPKENEKPDGKLLHQGDDGWVYERLSP